MNDDEKRPESDLPKPTGSGRASLGQRFLAGICKICPFCIAGRRWPDSKFGRFLREAEQNCPACRAYNRLQAAKREDPPQG